MNLKKAVFIDKDGTLIPDLSYNVHCDKIVISTPTIGALKYLSALNYKLIIVTNQSGIARGLLTEDEILKVRDHITELLSFYGVVIDGFYFCPHLPNGVITQYATDCDCRKPKPGMLFRAAADHKVDLSNSWMIGDKLTDVTAGLAAGCKTILIDPRAPSTGSDLSAKSFAQGAFKILS
jgi:D-glycero-D-manno-heptose 1,7-bisphosphate phosphatase